MEDLANGVSGTAGLLEHLDRARALDAWPVDRALRAPLLDAEEVGA